MNVEERRTTSDGAESTNRSAVEYERGTDETASEAVVTALSSAMEVPRTELDPIYDAIDPDALDSLFRSNGDAPPQFDGQVGFYYDDHRVRVDSDGTVLVY